jgi:hypothetical protein
MDPLVEGVDEIEEMLGTLLIARPPITYTSDSQSFRSSTSAVRDKLITVPRHGQLESGLRLKWIRLGIMEFEALNRRAQELILRWGERAVRLQWTARGQRFRWLDRWHSAHRQERGGHGGTQPDLLKEIATQAFVPPNVRVTCGRGSARTWQPEEIV